MGVEIARLDDVPVAGGALAIFELGSADDGAPVAIAAHGITSNSRAWLAVARALEGRVRLVAADLRGRGASGGLPAPFGLDSHVADLLAVADTVDVARPVFVGHSMGAYAVARLAAAHPERVAAAVLVDGALELPGAKDADPNAYLDRFLGPSIERLALRFASREAYHDFWRAHPALGEGQVDDEDLVAYADHDLVGEPPELRSSVVEDAVRADGADIIAGGSAAADAIEVPATLLHAPRGLMNQPDPMVPAAAVEAWAAGGADRTASLVPDVNHFTIAMGAGAGPVAEAVAELAQARSR